MKRAELWLAVAVTLVAVWLHFTLRASAGALWRDEAVSAGVASLPTLGDIWRHLQCDSFPLAWPVLLRLWGAVAPGDDGWLRTLGLLIGLAIPAALWLNARWIGTRIPLLGLLLLGLNAAAIAYGDSVRGYGLGMLAGILAFGLLWRVVEAPRPWVVALALAAALLAVHSLFYDCFLLLAACAGGAAVCVRHRRFKRAALVVAIGAVCALSVLPYRWTLGSSSEWLMLVRYDFVDLAWVWAKFEETTVSSGQLVPWLWVFTVLACLVAATRAQLRGRTEAADRDRALYCGVALAVGIPAYVTFLRLLRYVMQPWYFLALLALVAACADGCLAGLGKLRWVRVCRVAYVVLVGATLLNVRTMVSERKTTLDLVAARIERDAKPEDLIVVNPWIYGHTFRRYFHGPSRWTTLPPIEIPHLPGDYGLMKLKKQMMNRRAVEPVLSAMAGTLESGHRVWWVGNLNVPPPGTPSPDVEPAPNGPLGWHEGMYHELWGRQAAVFIAAHVLRGELAPIDPGGPVSEYENVSVGILSGWRP